MVKTVLPGSAAEAAGIQAGDIVQRLDSILTALASRQFVTMRVEKPAKATANARCLRTTRLPPTRRPRLHGRGFIAAETIGRSWFEYLIENARRQQPMSGVPLDQVEDDDRALERCAHRFFVEHEPR